MGNKVVILNGIDRIQGLFDFIGPDLGITVRHYPDTKGLITDINNKALPIPDISILLAVGCREQDDPSMYRKNLNLIRQFKNSSRLNKIPMLFLGYRGDTDLASSCRECGAEYLDLPVRKSELMERIRVLCGQSEPITIGQEGAKSQVPPITIGPEEAKIDVPPVTIGQNDQKMGSKQREKPAPITIGEAESAVEPITIGHETTETGVPPITIGPKAPKQGSEQPKKSPAEAERRLATIMFADISGFTAMSEKMDPEEVTRIMNQCFEMLGEHVEVHGGHIDKFIGDCVMVCFGVPTALENAPLSAVNTAIAMKKGLYEFNRTNKLSIPLDIHFGINTGMVVSGTVGSTDRKDYTVMGDAVNLASRIEGVSEKGQILVGPDTYHASRDDFEYRALPPVSLKGKAEPVPVYELLSVKEKAARRITVRQLQEKSGSDRMIYSELVGRDEEMNELRHVLTGLIMGKGGVVNVIGEAGIGKSRLMAELKSDPAMKQVTLLEGQAISMGRNLSFHPIIDLLKNWAGIREDDGPAEAFGKLEKAIRNVHHAEADEIVSFMGTMMGMKLSGKYAERVKGIEGEALEKLIFKNVRELIIKGSELRPMIIRIEDLHWADASSIEILTSLFKLANDHRILFLNFFRPNYEETGDRVIKIAKEDFNSIYTEIIIKPLDENESVTLISNLLKIMGLPQSLKDQIIDKAEGNPFFIEEVVRSLIDDGAVVKKGDSFAVTEKINDVKVPLTINEVLMSRIDRLDEETKNLIKTASVIGRYFFYKIITEVAVNISDIDRRLGYLEDIQLIRERKRLDELEYLFKHALAQETAYESLLIQKRRELHLHVAQSIENVFSERLNEFYGMLAFHYSKGESLDKAEEYMLKAGEESLKASASSEALEYFKNALAIYREKYGGAIDRERISAIEKNIAIAYYNKGKMYEAAPIFRKLLDVYHGKMPANRILQIIRSGIGFTHFLAAIYIPSLKFKKTPNEKDKAILDLFYYRLQTIINISSSQYSKEMSYVLKHISKFNFTHNHRAGEMLNMVPGAFSYAGILFILSKHILSFLRDKINTEDSSSVLWFEAGKILYNYYSGEWDSWEDFKDSIVQLALKNGLYFPVSTYVFWQFYYYLHKGKFNKAWQMVETLGTIATVYDHSHANILMQNAKTVYLVKVRKIEEASTEVEKGLQLAEKLNDESHLVIFPSFKSDLYLLMGDIDTSLRSLASAHNSFTPTLMPAVKSFYLQADFRAHLYRMEQFLRKGDTSNFRKIKDKASRSGKNQLKVAYRAMDFLTDGFMMIGTYKWLLGKPKQALRWWKRSIDKGESLGEKIDLSRTYFEIGKRLLEKPLTEKHARLQPKARLVAQKTIGLTAEEYLEKAEAMFREMDLRWDLEQLEKLRQGRPI